MKIRDSFVTNSSSSSFVIYNNTQYNVTLTKELIKECIYEIMETYSNLGSKILRKDVDGNENFFKYFPERKKDYQVFQKGEIKEIAEAFHNECWTASGVYIPDEIHNILKKVNSTDIYRSPSKKEVNGAIEKLTRFCIENKIKIDDIFNTEYLSKDEYDYVYDYYDHEYQQALRADFVIITGENAFPYSTYDLIEEILGAHRYHLG